LMTLSIEIFLYDVFFNFFFNDTPTTEIYTTTDTLSLHDALPITRARLQDAADRLSLRCCSGTPHSAHSAFCRPSASATKLSPPSTTWACSKPENASRKW